MVPRSRTSAAAPRRYRRNVRRSIARRPRSCARLRPPAPVIANASRELRNRISLRVETTISAGVFEAKLIDQMLFADHRAFRSLFKKISQSGVKKCIFNLSALTSIDSSGLGMFMVALDEAKKVHWALTIKPPQGHVKSLLGLSRFDKLLNIKAQAGGCLELASAILRAGSAQAIRRARRRRPQGGTNPDH